jgi:hypothetical protein
MMKNSHQEGAVKEMGEIALAHPDAALMQRMEESSFRQIWRITTLLLKTERQGREAETQ